MSADTIAGLRDDIATQGLYRDQAVVHEDGTVSTERVPHPGIELLRDFLELYDDQASDLLLGDVEGILAPEDRIRIAALTRQREEEPL